MPAPHPHVKRVVVALVMTLALAVAAIFLLKPLPVTPAAIPVAPAESLAAAGSGSGGSGGGGGGGIRVTLPSGVIYEFVPASTSQWTAAVTRPGKPLLRWPASSSRLRAALQLIADARGELPEAAGSLSPRLTLTGVGVAVEIAPGTPHAHTLQFDTTALGGKILVESKDKLLRVPVSLADLFADEGLALWLESHPFADPAPAQATEITLARNGKLVTLARSGNQWSIKSPVATLADRKAVADLFAAIAGLSTLSIEPPPAPNAAGERSMGEIRLTMSPTSARSLDLRLISPTSVTARAEVDGQAALITFSADPESLFPDAARLASRASLPTPAADVLSVAVSRDAAGGVTIERRAGAWTNAVSGKPLVKSAADELDAILKSLAETPADAVRLETPADFEPVGTLTVRDLSGSVSATFRVGSAKPPVLPGAPTPQPVLCILVGEGTSTISRLYAGKSTPPIAAWMRTHLQ